MGQTLTNGIYLPAEGERNCYEGLAANWTVLDGLIGGYNVHISNTTVHVTAEDKQAWNGKQDALSQTQLDAVNSGIDSTKVQQIATNTSDISSLQSGKANDSNVVHKSGNETVGGKKTFTDDMTASKKASNMAIYLQNLTYDPKTNGQSGIEGKSCNINFLTSTGDSYINISAYGLGERTLLRLTNYYFTDSQNVDYDSVEFSIYGNGARSFRPRNTNNCDLGESNKKWKGVYATNYYYGSNNVEFSTKFVTTDTNQTISGNKTFSSINGVEPSSLSLPSGNANDIIDISSYLTILDGSNVNTYIAPANGWIGITMSNSSGIQAYITGFWGHQVIRPSAGAVRFLMPILKNQTANIMIFNGSISYARFIPCQGNV